jgi:hypothetical protein
MFACMTATFVAHQSRGGAVSIRRCSLESVCAFRTDCFCDFTDNAQVRYRAVERSDEQPTSLATRLFSTISQMCAKSVGIATAGCF